MSNIGILTANNKYSEITSKLTSGKDYRLQSRSYFMVCKTVEKAPDEDEGIIVAPLTITTITATEGNRVWVKAMNGGNAKINVEEV